MDVDEVPVFVFLSVTPILPCPSGSSAKLKHCYNWYGLYVTVSHLATLLVQQLDDCRSFFCFKKKRSVGRAHLESNTPDQRRGNAFSPKPSCPTHQATARPTQVAITLYPSSCMLRKRNYTISRWVDGAFDHRGHGMPNF